MLLLHEPQCLNDRNTLDAEDRKVGFFFSQTLVITITLRIHSIPMLNYKTV